MACCWLQPFAVSVCHTGRDRACHVLSSGEELLLFQPNCGSTFASLAVVRAMLKSSHAACRVITERIAVHKYPLKVAKAKAGSKKAKASSSTEKEISYYAQFDKEAQDNCISGKQAFAAAKNE